MTTKPAKALAVTLNARPVRIGKPFRCLRDPGRKHFGYIDRVSVIYQDGKSPVSECMTVAQLNNLLAKARS